MLKKTLFINGIERRTVAAPDCSLTSFLRKQMSLSGVKSGHGACTVLLDGSAVKGCAVKMKDVPIDARITTIEGVGTSECLHPLQKCWILHGAAQCGDCTPGYILSAKALLDENADPAKEEVIAWFAEKGNACEHSCPDKAAAAVLDAAKLLSGKATFEELWLKAKDEAYTPGAELADAEAVGFVTGAFETGADLGLSLPEGVLHAKLVCPSDAPASVFSVDVSEAEKVRGVYKVVTAKDVAGTNRVGAFGKILCDRTVSGAGDAVAAVLAFSPAAACEAVAGVKVKLEKDGEGGGKCACAAPAVAFAYTNEKGKLVIHSQRDDLDIPALADGIGIPHGKLAVVHIPGHSAGKGGAVVEGIAGAAALAAGKPVYIEL